MRLTFLNAEQPDKMTAASVISVGSNSDNTIVLAADGVQPLHACIFVDARGIVLSVIPPARVHVNARRVREKALLRIGDLLSIDTIQILLKPDRDDDIQTQLTEIKPQTKRVTSPHKTSAVDSLHRMPSRIALRGVSGNHFGRIFVLRARMNIGSGTHCDLRLDGAQMPRELALIEYMNGMIQLRDLGSTQITRVNGVLVRDAILYSGDQIAFDCNRFIIEAPGLPQRLNSGIAPNSQANQFMSRWQGSRIPEHPIPAKLVSRNEIWWLIGVAVLIGIGIASALLVKF